MSRRITALAAGLALASGVALAGSGTALAGTQAPARSVPALSIAMNHTSFVASQNGVLSVHLGVRGGGQRITLIRTLPSGTRHSLGVYTTDKHGNVSTKVSMLYNSFYTATWSGNSAYYPASRRTPTIRVAAYLKTAITGYYGTSGSYHLVHNGKHGELDVFVFPSKAGQKVNFPLQSYYGGKWHNTINHSYTLEAHSSEGVTYSITGTSFVATKGYPCRIRAEYHGDRYDGGRVSGWYYVKFV